MRDKVILPNLATRIINTPLMITMDKLNAVIGAVGPRIGLQVPAELLSPVYMGPDREREDSEDGTGIAVIPVYDMLVYRTNGLFTLSGLTSYERIRADFRAAMTDESIETIIFDIDSPGGEVAGVFDLVDEIYEARGKKSILAVANEDAFSAAYAIASAAEKIFLPRTGGVGSVGVIAIHTDQSSFDEKIGVKYTPIFAGARKNDFSRHEPLSEDAQKIAQADIDEVYELFTDTVARNRDMTVQAVRNTEAAIFQGKKAVKAGFADEVLSWDKVIADITHEKRGGVFMSWKEKLHALFSDVPTKEELNEELAKAGFVAGDENTAADLASGEIDVDKIKEEALTDAKEIMNICSLAGMPDMALDLVNKGVSAEEARKRVLEAKAEQGEEDEIVSTVGATTTGEANPLIADAERRAKEARA